MAGQRPFILTVFDPSQGRLLRIEELPSEEALVQRHLEERDHYARHPHVEVESHWGRSADEVRSAYAQRLAHAPTA